MKFTAQILKFDEKSPATGVVYRREEMEKIIEEFNKREVNYGQLAEGNEPFEISKISNKVSNLRILGNGVFADIELVNSPNGVFCKNLIRQGEKLATAPRIEVDENGNLIDLISVDIIKDDRKAFEENTLKPEE